MWYNTPKTSCKKLLEYNIQLKLLLLTQRPLKVCRGSIIMPQLINIKKIKYVENFQLSNRSFYN